MLACIPNVSEGRDQTVLKELVEAFGGAPGVSLLDIHSDPDHNRSVLTAVGIGAELAEGAYRLIEAAGRKLDIRKHHGVHPRMGAVDVCPFVPLAGTPLEEAVSAARALADRVGSKLGIPVYLYGEAAESPQRRELPRIRRRDPTTLAERISTDPAWRPDRGPARLHERFGAIAIGARRPLVAYNVELDTQDVKVAEKIAKSVREKNGGLAGVRALGLFLSSRKRAQVSCNLVEGAPTTPAALFEKVRDLAAAQGVKVARSELVGLMPREVAYRSLREALALEAFSEKKVLEDNLSAALPLSLYLASIWRSDGGPGGGTVAADAAAAAAALSAFVCAFGLKESSEHRRWFAAQAFELHRLGLQDQEAYQAFSKALKEAKKKGGSTREAAEALRRACLVPLAVLERIASILGRLCTIELKRRIAADRKVAAYLLSAAAKAAREMIRVNLEHPAAAEFQEEFTGRADLLLQSILEQAAFLANDR